MSVSDVPKDVARLVTDLIEVVSCTVYGALREQEELERHQHTIWRREDLHLAEQAEKKRIEREKRYERLHSPSEDSSRRKYLIARVNETTGVNTRAKVKTKQIQKLQAFVFPGSEAQVRLKTPATNNVKSSYEKLLDFCTQQQTYSKTPVKRDQPKLMRSELMEDIRDKNTRSRGDTRGMFLAFQTLSSPALGTYGHGSGSGSEHAI